MGDLQPWEKALNKFLTKWKYQQKTVGVLVCGSFITGSPTKQSDLDVHIVLSADTSFRERGNQIVDGILIEYFANPPAQIEQYFKEDFESYSRVAMVQFLTGYIISDPHGIVHQLKVKAKEWFDRPLPSLNESMLELEKYSLWDMRDNLIALNAGKSPSFFCSFHYYLFKLVDLYRKYLGYDVIKPDKIYEIFTSQSYRRKYLLPPFPDEEFGNLVVQALQVTSDGERVDIFTELVNHIFKQWKGFTIHGWEFHSPLSI
ncbi:hypothetical protein NEF87_002309 [Candidatus Lokiarchaeum ossiferum]|uniref:Polymerase nucleotidyl transferase domain-containing protein n=1 Tax=Candidatus Lokiarchaeum ossiferum TaxID=2951803 RepID=A0ABY6HU04_9ARCH|nr:hypothetical protein NEF87_002309 [Candidatus Lokiarchaeum sp. B-35]